MSVVGRLTLRGGILAYIFPSGMILVGIDSRSFAWCLS